MLLRNVSWETYERLIDEREERRVPRFFYDRGVMEISSPSKEHETVARVVALLVEELAVEWDLDLESAGSTTFKREDLARLRARRVLLLHEHRSSAGQEGRKPERRRPAAGPGL